MLLLSRNVLSADIDQGGAQNSWDSHIVYNSKGDVGGLTLKGHTKTKSANNGFQPPLTS